jgi:glyoxylase-like metal-dependent hydrolase (beta-lactamase superfamily II)
MTLDGTNTWILAEPGSPRAVVVDPGPGHDGHLHRVRDQVAGAGQRVAEILLTHSHADHSAGAAAFAALTGAPVRAADPAYRLGNEGLAPGNTITAAGCEIHVVATPGHSADSVCLHLPADHALLTGDTVLGRGTTVIRPRRTPVPQRPRRAPAGRFAVTKRAVSDASTQAGAGRR